MTVSRLRIECDLVGYLRKGVLLHMGAALEALQTQVEQNEGDAVVYGRALRRLDEARELLEVIGFGTDSDRDIDLDVERWRPLVTKALETQHAIEVARLTDAIADGVTLPPREIHALGQLVAELKQPKAPVHRRRLFRPARRRGGA